MLKYCSDIKTTIKHFVEMKHINFDKYACLV